MCEEVAFSVDDVDGAMPRWRSYTTAVCRQGSLWKWAAAEPASEEAGQPVP